MHHHNYAIDVFCFVLIRLYSLYVEYDSPLLPTASRLAGWMAEIRSYYTSSPSDKRKRKAQHLKVVYVNYKGNVMTSGRDCRLLLLLLLLRTFGRELPNISSYQEVHHRLIALLHGSSSETYRCRHLPALHPVAFPTPFQSVFCWSFQRLRWRKRCSGI